MNLTSGAHMAVREATGPSCQKGGERSRAGAALSFRNAPPAACHVRKDAHFWQTCKISSLSSDKYVISILKMRNG
jgi:hypothetical protein